MRVLRPKVLRRFVLTLVLLAALSSASKAAEATPDAGSLNSLAAESYPDLNQTENNFLRAAASGETMLAGDVKDDKDPKNDPANADLLNWKRDRSVRADLIRWLCENRDAGKLVSANGIQLKSAWIDGNLDLSHVIIPFPLILTKCNIPDGIKLNSSELPLLILVGSHTGAINARGVVVRSDVLLSNEFHSTGEVDFYGAKIGGNFYCADATFSNPGKETLSIELASVDGGASLDQGFQSDGIVQMTGATIKGYLSMDHAKFATDAENGLDARGMKLDGEFQWTNVERSPSTILDLSYANVSTFKDDEKSWPNSGHLSIDGFVYGAIDGLTNTMNPREVTRRLDWIRRQAGFSPQPYQELAAVLRQGGRDGDATQVLIAKEVDMREYVAQGTVGSASSSQGRGTAASNSGADASTASANAMARPRWSKGWVKGLLTRFVGFTLWITIDYGYQPLRALWWIVGFVIAGALIFRWGYRTGIVLPSDHSAFEVFSKSGTLPENYPAFNSFVYSLETFLPLVELYQAKYWTPARLTGGRRSPRLLRIYLWIHILLGWFFALMLAAGLSGLVRAT